MSQSLPGTKRRYTILMVPYYLWVAQISRALSMKAMFLSSTSPPGVHPLVTSVGFRLTQFRCGHCKRLAPSWVELARITKDKLTVAEVNCDDHSSLCRSQGVTGYPMLFYYSGNQGVKTEYTGSRKLEPLKAFAERISQP